MKFKQIAVSLSTAALSTCAGTTQAFQVGSRSSLKANTIRTPAPHHLIKNALPLSIQSYSSTPPRCLFGTNSSDDSGGSKSILGKIGGAIKSVFKGDKKKGQSLTKKEQAKEEVSSSIDTLFKDAPLGVRMMGKMIKPLVSSMAGNLAEAMEEQSRQMSDILSDARALLVQDTQAIRLLGEPIEVGNPFSQSSSTMSINGQTQVSIQVSFEVMGRNGRGVASLSAVNGQIQNLTLSANGRNIAIDTTRSAGSSTTVVDDFGSRASSSTTRQSEGLGKNRGPSNVIDAEFVEKKVDK